MKKWSLLSIPLVGFAGITVWAQAVTGAPTGLEPGVIVTEGAPRHSVQKLDGSTENRRLSPATDPTASSPLSTKAAEPSRTAQAPEDPSADSSGSTEESSVEFVEPAQVTSPAPAPTDDSTSSSQLDDKGGLSSNNGRSGSSNG
jgi:hypothetical protein